MLSKNQALASALDSDLIAFMTTVTPSGQPKTSPIWFIRDGEDLVMYSQPNALKLSNIAVNPKTSFTLRADERGHRFVLIDAASWVDAQLPPAKDLPGFVDKYAGEIASLGWTPESFSGDYSVGVRMKVTGVRARGN